jgi:hypothetical protein
MEHPRTTPTHHERDRGVARSDGVASGQLGGADRAPTMLRVGPHEETARWFGGLPEWTDLAKRAPWPGAVKRLAILEREVVDSGMRVQKLLTSKEQREDRVRMEQLIDWKFDQFFEATRSTWTHTRPHRSTLLTHRVLRRHSWLCSLASVVGEYRDLPDELAEAHDAPTGGSSRGRECARSAGRHWRSGPRGRPSAREFDIASPEQHRRARQLRRSCGHHRP